MTTIKPLLLPLLLVLCLSCAKMQGPGPLGDITPAKRAFDAAESHYQSGEYDQALTGFQSYLAAYPDTDLEPDARLRIAQLRALKRQYNRAKTGFQEVVEGYPDTPQAREAWVWLLEMYVKTEAHHQAALARGKVLALPLSREQRRRANLAIGNAYFALKSPADACEAFINAFQLSQEGEKKAVLEKLTPAIARMDGDSLAEALERLAGFPPSADLKYQLGVRRMEEGDSDAAKAVLADFIRRFPSDERVAQAQALIDKMNAPGYGDTGETVIGCLLPMTGRYAKFGQQAYNGIEFALSRFVQQPDGRRVKMLLKDTGSNARKTRQAVDELANAGAVAIVGPIGTVDEAAQEAQKYRIPIITLTQKDNATALGDCVFRNFLTPRMQVKALVSYGIKVLGATRFAVLYPAESYGQTHMRLFESEVTAGGGVMAGAESYSPGITDFAGVIKKLAGTPPAPSVGALEGPMTGETPPALAPSLSQHPFDAVFIPDSADKAGIIIPQLAYYDVRNVYLLGTNLWHSDNLLKQAGENLGKAVIAEGFFDGSASGHVRDFVSGFKAAYGDKPGFIEAVSYDSAMILFELAARPNVRERADIQKALLAMIPYEGVTGKTTFDENREAVKDIYLLKVVDGRFQEVGGMIPYSP